ncbi:MAG: CHASE3 domain-containing protein, partial [Alphaproteobacteria bacterium]|nr:CHASE3 domain-containing protein [Alphaproteobacteria bacterium]
MFTNLSVSRKLAIAFAAVLLAIVAMGGVVFYNLQALDRAGVLRAEVNEAVRDTAFAELKVVRQENSMRGYLLSGDRYYLERLDVHRADFKKALSELKAVPGMDIASDVATVETAADEWFENVVVAGSALAANPETRAQAVAMIGREGSADVYIGKVEEALEAVKAINAEQIDVAVKAQAGAARTALLALIVGLIAATLIAIGAGLMVTRALIGPIQNLIGYMKRIMAGDLDVEVPCAQRKDEFGQFGVAILAFRDAAQDKLRVEAEAVTSSEAAEAERARNQQQADIAAGEQAIVVEALGEGLDHLMRGDLTYTLTQSFPADYAKLQADFNAAIGQLKEAMSVVSNNVSAIRSGAGEIAQASDDLSRRTEQQAASLEETAAALDEITAR